MFDELNRMIELEKEFIAHRTKSTMKPFNLEEAKAGKSVQTRGGRKARIICFDAINHNNSQYIVALVNFYDNNEESVYTYDLNGKYSLDGYQSNLDLVMVPEKKTGWINIYPASCGGPIYTTKEQALKSAVISVVDTIQIKWEE